MSQQCAPTSTATIGRRGRFVYSKKTFFFGKPLGICEHCNSAIVSLDQAIEINSYEVRLHKAKEFFLKTGDNK
jgi:hypothetical protein